MLEIDDGWSHYSDVIMSTMAPQITGLTIVYSTCYPGADQRKHQSSASLAFVRGIHRWPVSSPQKGPVTRKMFPFDDDIMEPRQQYPSDLLSGVIYAGQQISRVLWPHDDVIKWKLFPRHQPVVRAIRQLPRLRRMRDVTMKVSLVLSLNIFYRIYDRYKVVWSCYNRDRWRLVQGCCRNSRPTITNPLTIVPPTPEMIITK